MACQAVLPKFREIFTTSKIDYRKWFPGHMASGIRDIEKQLKNVDCVIELHDARIPISGRNPTFHRMFSAVKPHLFVLNKVDMADLSRKEEIEMILKKSGVTRIMYTNCQLPYHAGIKDFMPTVVKMIKNSDRYNRMDIPEFTLMVLGIPNVGKSSLINSLRTRHMKRRTGAPVGADPGITRHVMERIKIHHDPPIYVLDTPGVLAPSVKNIETGLRLALCKTTKGTSVSTEVLADYLLYWLNKHKNFDYVDFLKLEKPTDDIREVLLRTAINLHAVMKIKNMEGTWETKYNFIRAANYFISAFREGVFGKVMLDDDYLPKIKVM